MSAGRAVAWLVVALVLGAALGAALYLVPRWLAQTAEPPARAETPQIAATRHIKATLFYVSEDGLRLVPVEREVVFGGSVLEQARRILEAQLAPAPAPLTSAVPAGTSLRSLFVSDRGEAYVDLSPEVSTVHPGGALTELLTVYSIVNVLTTNLPALSAVQILVDGREVDTLAGHVDLRRPLAKSTLLIETATEPAQAAPAGSPAATPAPLPPASPDRTPTQTATRTR